MAERIRIQKEMLTVFHIWRVTWTAGKVWEERTLSPLDYETPEEQYDYMMMLVNWAKDKGYYYLVYMDDVETDL